MISTLLHRVWDALARFVRTLVSSPMALISAPKRLMGLSLPARVALMVFLFLAIAATTVIVMHWLNPDRPYLSNLLTPRWILGLVFLIAVIPPFAYWTVKLWLEPEVSEFPDIDDAWREGMRALAERGVDLHTTPIFLILGPRHQKEVQTLFKAAQLNLVVEMTPSHFAALHWGATSEAIYLVCTKASCLSKLAFKGTDAGSSSTIERNVAPAAQDTFRGTVEIGARQTAAPLTAGPPTAGLMTAAPDALATAPPGFDYRGTMQAFDADGATARPGATALGGRGFVPQLPKQETEEEKARLAYVCSLLRKARQPVVPVNGVLTLLPFSFIQHSDSAGIALRFAVQNDLDTLLENLRVRCPVAALVGEMETEPGFQELVRRVGPTIAKKQRFGKGFNVWNAPTAEQLEAVSTHACGAFEDFTYKLFKEAGGLQKVRNKQLYALLCKVRHRLRSRLEDILVNAYGFDPERRADANPQKLLFSGCYFGATGERDDQQAFVWSVMEDKLLHEEGELDWTEAALAEDDRYHGWARVALTIAFLAGAAIVAIVAVNYFDLLPKAS